MARMQPIQSQNAACAGAGSKPDVCLSAIYAEYFRFCMHAYVDTV